VVVDQHMRPQVHAWSLCLQMPHEFVDFQTGYYS